MPSRMIRGDDLLDSERYMRLPADAQVFYVHCLLTADDFGCLLLTPTSLRRRLYIDPPTDTRIESRIKLVSEADLMRIYWLDGVRFAFLPRYRQALKKYMSRCPMPPPELFTDDEHAAEKFKLFKDKFKKFATIRNESSPVRNESSPEVKRSEVEEKGREVEVRLPPVGAAAADAAGAPTTPSLREVGQQVKGNSKGVYSEKLNEQGAALGIPRNPGESDNYYAARISQAMTRAA